MMPFHTCFDLELDASGRLILTDLNDGGKKKPVTTARAFPLSAPDGWIALRDEAGRECALIESPPTLDADTRRLVENDLARREFRPVIRRILSVSSVAEPCEWDVETDRGRVRFILMGEDRVRILSSGQVVVTDSNGLRYLIPDAGTLDPKSRRILERYT